MYYIWLGIYEMYYMYLYMYWALLVLFRVLFVWGSSNCGLVYVHENRGPLDLLGPLVPYLLGFNDLFLFLAGREECGLVSFHSRLGKPQRVPLWSYLFTWISS